MFSLALVLSVCMVGALANPSKVCMPDQWSGVLFGGVAQVLNGEPHANGISGYTATDYPKKMEFLLQNITVNGAVSTYIQLTDFNKRMTYEIQPAERKCTPAPLPADYKMRQYCQGDADVKVLNELNVGGSVVQVVEFAFSGQKVYTSLTKRKFIPIMTVLEQTYKGIPQMITHQYGNVTEKIEDPKIFELPSYCTPPTPHKRVCAPDQFKAVGLAVVAQSAGGKPMALPTEFISARDFKAKKEVTASITSYQGQQYMSKSFIDWNQDKMYIVNEKMKTCNVTKALAPKMIELCSDSKDLTLVRSYMLNGKMADMYLHSGGEVKTEFAVFRDTFEPITSLNEQKVLGLSQVIATQFGNMTVGIKDPKIFDPPSYCKHDVLLD